MSKWFEVKVTSVKVFVIEVEDNETPEEAYDLAINAVGDFDEAECSEEITDPALLNIAKRHADEVYPLCPEEAN